VFAPYNGAMRWWLVFVVALAACGDQLQPPCSRPCGDGCPSGMTCSVGFCADAGETCEPTFETVATGTGFACALDQFDRAWCWGTNDDRQLADDERRTFTRATVAGARRWQSISAGGGHACALDGGELWCWGRNDRNQVTSTIVGDVPAPIRIEVDGKTVTWSKVATGFDYTCGIAAGQVFCWGAGEAGKLGGGSPNDAPRPQQIQSDISDFVDIAAGLRHTCAVSTSLGVWCWGDGSNGQLGNSRFNVKLEPQSAGLIGATQIAVGLETSCAVTNAGALFCWGRAGQGALGDPAVIDPEGDNLAVPTQATLIDDWVEVATAERFACGRRGNGDVYCWGTARSGGLGLGRWNQSRGFAKVLEGATALDVGWNATDSDPGRDEGDQDLACAIVDGRVSCWGDNRAGQLAQGGATRAELPVEIAGEHRWGTLAAGAQHVCGGADTGSAQLDIYCWGSVELGQVAGVEAGRTTPCTAEVCDVAAPRAIDAGLGTLFGNAIETGANHTCIRSTTEVACWGDSRLGQTGTMSAMPVPPALVAGEWLDVFAGANATCASDAAGEVTCWGEALDSHPPEIDPELAGATELVFGFDFGCALGATDGLTCFGDNTGGAFGNGAPGSCGDAVCNADETGATCAADCGPAPLTATGRSYQAIAIGRSGFACGLRSDGRIECWGDNLDGQCGSFELSTVFEPNMIADAADCTQLAAGRSHACAVCGPAIVCWGDARHGEVGPPASLDPAFSGRRIPPPDGEQWSAVTAGDGFTCGVTASGRGFCWGTSLHGALGNGIRGANLPMAIKLEGGE
jgi:alpha-tubulin suppressor-like RCC1 family protein